MRERNHFIGLWLNDEEYAHLREQCELTRLSASVLIRQALARVQLRHRPPDEYATLLRALSAIGNNINQISHWANAQKSIQEADVTMHIMQLNGLSETEIDAVLDMVNYSSIR